MTGTALGPAASYLPHKPPMLLIDEVLEVTDDRGICRTTIRPDCVFAIDGVVHPAAMIEFIAQSCAIAVGVLAARNGNPPRLGMIMACREASFTVDHFSVGDQLTITVNKVLGLKMMGAFACTVVRDGATCVTLQLSVVDADLAAAPPSGDDG
jgi:predicted hotdog family 3-hydroxylacyl-ACP dehydratase